MVTNSTGKKFLKKMLGFVDKREDKVLNRHVGVIRTNDFRFCFKVLVLCMSAYQTMSGLYTTLHVGLVQHNFVPFCNGRCFGNAAFQNETMPYLLYFRPGEGTNLV